MGFSPRSTAGHILGWGVTMHGVKTDPSDILGKESTPIDSKTLARSSAHLKHAVELDGESAKTPEKATAADFDSLITIVGDLIKSVNASAEFSSSRFRELEVNLPVSLKDAVSAAAMDEIDGLKDEVQELKVQIEGMQTKEMMLIKTITELRNLIHQRIPSPQ